MKTDIAILGAGTGGCAAALAAAEAGRSVVMTSSNGWIGGQLTAQMVPPDEHWAVERYGCTRSYRQFRNKVRSYYLNNYPLLPKFRDDPYFNPGGGRVSRLCFEPRVGLAVLWEMLMRHISSGKLKILHYHTPVACQTHADRIQSVELLDQRSGHTVTLEAAQFLEATELGDLLPMCGEDYVTGAESQSETGEPHALPGPSNPEDVQAFTWCMAISRDHTESPDTDRYRIDPPAQYQRWKNYIPQLTPPWPGPLFSWQTVLPPTLETFTRELFEQGSNGVCSLWRYRQIISREHFCDSFNTCDTTCVNWPQNDYIEGNIIDKPPELVEKYLEESRQLTLSLFYWLQNDAPRPDGGQGFGNLFPRPDLTGNHLGLAQEPYFRESRRIKGLFTVTQNHVGKEVRGGRKAEQFPDSVGVGYYRIDLHPSAAGRNYIDIDSLPFQIPLGALIPRRHLNLIAACKNISVTHIANGCYRLHPVEWNIGEVAGALADFCLRKGVPPRKVREDSCLLEEFQSLLFKRGVDLEWPAVG